jgi:hypothetical protein
VSKVTVEYLRACISEPLGNEFSLVDAHAAFNALVADALRYRGMRLFMTEPDDACQEALLTAWDAVTNDAQEKYGQHPTAEQVDATFDAAIVAAAQVRAARNANN